MIMGFQLKGIFSNNVPFLPADDVIIFFRHKKCPSLTIFRVKWMAIKRMRDELSNIIMVRSELISAESEVFYTNNILSYGTISINKEEKLETFTSFCGKYREPLSHICCRD